MSDKKKLAVAIIGIADQERNVLKNIFKLSLYRAYTYTFTAADEPGEILIVDGDDPQAMAAWSALQGDASKKFSLNSGAVESTVMVTKERNTNHFPYHIHRPFVATRVLGALDQIAEKAVAAPQERIISDAQLSVPCAIVDAPMLPTALVVDDSGTIRKQIALELKLFDIQVDTAESGERALELLCNKNYDMIFLDVVLPGVDGYHICKVIKKDKTIKKTPVIMLTSKSSPFDRVKGSLAGCDTYLTKPVKQSSFQKVVKKYLKP